MDLGRYRLVARLGAGGMGEVYKAIASGPGGVEKLVAVKLIKPDRATEPAFVRMFEEEMKVSFLLTHGSVVQTYDAGRIDDRYFIAMEYVEGLTLRTLLDRLPREPEALPHRHAVYVAAEALQGLDYVHRARDLSKKPLGLVHRDVSPSNLFVSRSGEVKVGDFGIALSTLRASTTVPGTLKGKVAYMPPEQLRGEPLDARTDVYAMGVVLYEMLTSRKPYDGPSGGLPPLILEGRFRRPRELEPAIPAELEEIVVRAMSVRREARPESAGAMRDALEHAAMRAGWTLSPSSFAQLVQEIGTDAGVPLGEPVQLDLRRVSSLPGGLTVLSSTARGPEPHEKPTVAAKPTPVPPQVGPTETVPPPSAPAPAPTAAQAPRHGAWLPPTWLLVIFVLGTLAAGLAAGVHHMLRTTPAPAVRKETPQPVAPPAGAATAAPVSITPMGPPSSGTAKPDDSDP